jgi:hypothetical protein
MRWSHPVPPGGSSGMQCQVATSVGGWSGSCCLWHVLSVYIGFYNLLKLAYERIQDIKDCATTQPRAMSEISREGINSSNKGPMLVIEILSGWKAGGGITEQKVRIDSLHFDGFWSHMSPDLASLSRDQSRRGPQSLRYTMVCDRVNQHPKMGLPPAIW